MAEASCACAVASWAAVAKSHTDQRLHWIGRVLDEFGGEFHVLLGGEVGHQIVELEYKANIIPSVRGKLLLGIGRNILSVHQDLSFRRRVHPPQNVKDRGLARAAWPYHYREFALLDLEVDSRGGHDLNLAHIVYLFHAL